MQWDQQQQQQQQYSYDQNPYTNNGHTQTESYSNQQYYQSADNGSSLRRRNTNSYETNYNNNLDPSSSSSKYNKPLKQKIIQNTDLFPKTESGLTIQTSTGQSLSTITLTITIILLIFECHSWYNVNNTTQEKIFVEKSLGQKMRVDLNISFPSLHCDDLHLDLMDVAGDVQLDVEDSMLKRRLHIEDGSPLSKTEIEVEMNKAFQAEAKAREAVKATLVENYCGPCYGAGENGQCCNYCDDVIEAYKKRHWHADQVKMLAEQCVREHKTGPKAMKKGEGCNIAGYMKFNRVNGNFHIAMGEGVERNGHLIHTFLPDDVANFNSSHIIHELRFGPAVDPSLLSPIQGAGAMGEMDGLNGVQKIVTEKNGETGTFQYFIKIVPTTYKGRTIMETILSPREFKDLKSASKNKGDEEEVFKLETNRYFTTERFVPLMAEEIDEEHYDLGDLIHDDDVGGNDDDEPIAGVKVGGNTGTSHSHHQSHRTKQQILPGVFFIYQVYPFAIEVTKDRVSITHLLIRIMAMAGGVFTIAGWFDTFLYSRKQKNGGNFS